MNVFVCCGYVSFHIFSCVEKKPLLHRWGSFLDCKLFRAGNGLLLRVCTALLLPWPGQRLKLLCTIAMQIINTTEK